MNKLTELLVSKLLVEEKVDLQKKQDSIFQRVNKVASKNIDLLYNLALKLYDEEEKRQKNLDEKGLTFSKISGGLLIVTITGFRFIEITWIRLFLLGATLFIFFSTAIGLSAVKAKSDYKIISIDDILNEQFIGNGTNNHYLKFVIIHIFFVWSENNYTNELKGRLVAISNRLFIYSLVFLLPIVIIMINSEVIKKW